MFTNVFVSVVLLLASVNNVAAVVYRRQHDFAHGKFSDESSKGYKYSGCRVDNHGLKKAANGPHDFHRYVVGHPRPTPVRRQDCKLTLIRRALVSDLIHVPIAVLSGLLAEFGGAEGLDSLVDEIISALPPSRE